MRANPEEGREAYSHGTYLNGFHETWRIHHAEDAFGFAKLGQTIVNVPDAKLMKLYIDDEPLLLTNADLEAYERVLDFRAGTLTRDLIWRTPAGKRVRVRSQRLVCLAHRHLAMLTFEVTMLDGQAPVVVSSQMLNRQDGEDEYHVARHALGHGADPRKMRSFDHRVLEPRLHRHDHRGAADDGVVLGYRCANSGMTLACAYRHLVETSCEHHAETTVGEDLAKTVFTARMREGDSLRITKLVTYHTSTGVPAEELADRCHRTLDRAVADGRDDDPRRAARVARRVLGRQRRRAPRRRPGPAGDALEPVPARPGERPDAGARHRRQGRHRRRLRGPLLLGHRDVRRPVPRLHEPRARPQGAAVPLAPAAPGPPAGRSN